jgi:branched-chain amino acid transport system permease protein
MTSLRVSRAERFVPSPSEAVLLGVMLAFSWWMFGGTEHTALAGLSTVAVVALAWVVGVAVRSATADMRWWLATGAVLALLVPWLAANTVQISIMSEVCVFALMLTGLNIVTGYTGQVSLGHGALVGIGAYTTAILMAHYDWPAAGAAAAAVVVTAGFGFAIGVPALRLAGPYLAIATLGAALVFPGVMKMDGLSSMTGGVQGLHASRVSPPGPIEDALHDSAPASPYQSEFQKQRFATETYLYYLALVPAALGLAAAWNLGRSRFGRAFVAVREAETAATSMGINVALYRVLAFGISGLYAGLAGALLFLVVAYVSPDSFDLVNTSINPLAYVVIGGLATTGGAVVGALGYMWVPQVVTKIGHTSKDFGNMQGGLTGLMLIVIMTRMPEGVWGAAVRLNRLSWSGLRGRLRLPRGAGEWQAALPWGLGALAVIGVSAWFGTIWAVFAAALLVVMPRDLWRWRR